MYYIYILLNSKQNFYTGYTNDLKNRILQHRLGKVYSTKSKLPVKFIYYEACCNKYDALKREKYLKSGPGKRFLKKRLKRYLAEAS